MAGFLGLGNGAVFKMVPAEFPEATGAATGIVGAAGGLGGFFPPLVMGVVKDATGEFVLGFVFLVAFACMCAGLVAPLVKPRRRGGRRWWPTARSSTATGGGSPTCASRSPTAATSAASYCMPAEGLPWLERDEILTFEEIDALVRLLRRASASRTCASPAASRWCAATSRRWSRCWRAIEGLATSR